MTLLIHPILYIRESSHESCLMYELFSDFKFKDRVFREGLDGREGLRRDVSRGKPGRGEVTGRVTNKEIRKCI